MTTSGDFETGRPQNGAAMAAMLAAAVGSFMLGLLVIANEAGLYSAPSIYPSAGGLSGRAAFATATWLIAWGVLHARWRRREIRPRVAFGWTLLLVVLALVATFPPVWALL